MLADPVAEEAAEIKKQVDAIKAAVAAKQAPVPEPAM